MNDNKPTLDKIKLVQSIREGGHTERCHVLPHHGEYSNAKHQWGVAMLVLFLHPDPSLTLVKAALLHDVPERWVGDVPAPAKWWLNPEYGKQAKATERLVEERLGIVIDLGLEDKNWLDSCDVLDLWLWCWDQINLGNQHVQGCRQNCEKWFHDNASRLPQPVLQFFVSYKWSRTDEDGWWKEGDMARR